MKKQIMTLALLGLLGGQWTWHLVAGVLRVVVGHDVLLLTTDSKRVFLSAQARGRIPWSVAPRWLSTQTPVATVTSIADARPRARGRFGHRARRPQNRFDPPVPLRRFDG